jgi:long-subunit fatty acid transport protein
MRGISAAFALACAVLASTGTARAGGFDTPMLYSARHMGMGGTAVSYVNDGSSLFHNPAGLGNIDKANVMLDITLLLGSIQGSPSGDPALAGIRSNTTFAPFGLLGGGARLFDVDLGDEMTFGMVAGAAVYPVASAGGAYDYTAGGTPTHDATTLVFLEASPGIAFDLSNTPVGTFTLGGSWRAQFVSLSREIDPNPMDSMKLVDFSANGWSFTGFKLGFQWAAPEYVKLGISYRHQTDTEINAGEGTVLNLAARDIGTTFTLPSRLIWGIRGDYAGIGLAVDIEYAFNSQNGERPVCGIPEATSTELCVSNVFNWRDAMTLRIGAEYDIHLTDEEDAGILTPRLGFVFDDTTANPIYPTAFGTPPGPTFVGTIGVGFDNGPWEVNAAYAYRRGSATVTAADIAMQMPACQFCGAPGEYDIELHGIYLDFSYDFE